MAVIDTDAIVLSEHKRRILTDTGYCCRNLLGWDYDEYGGIRTNEGTGGVRNYGSHQGIVDLIDDESIRFKLIEAPRGSYKSTILQGFCVRQMLANPNIRIFYVSRTDKIALEKSTAIRSAMDSEQVSAMFGQQEGLPWEDTRFTVAGRTQGTLMNPTFSTFSMQSPPTGGRADILVLDDPINEEDCTNPEQTEKSKRRWQMIHPFLSKGGILIVVGTRYAADDLFNDLEQSPLFCKPMGRSFVIGAGVHVVKDDETGKLSLEPDDGGLTFPHMTLDFLNEKFMGMVRGGKFIEFSCQYLNVVPAGSGALFERWMFQPIKWGSDMRQLTGFVLTDTAVSMKDAGCFSVIAYAGLDAADNMYLFDLRVGHWDQREFIAQFFSVLEHWQDKLNHVGEVWEEIALAGAYEFSIRDVARTKNIKVNSIRTKRANADSKDMRILRLQLPMHDRKFYVVDTVPRTYDDLDGTKMLFEPEGYLDARTKIKQPGGELVDEFVRFRATGVKKDIADTLGLLLEQFRVGSRITRYCRFRPSRKVAPMTLTEERIRDYRATIYPAASGGLGASWWEQAIHEHSDKI